MAPEEICKLLETKFGSDVVQSSAEAGRPFATVAMDRWREIAKFLRNDRTLGFNLLNSITALDLLEAEKFACIYDVSAVPLDRGSDLIKQSHFFAIRVEVPRDNPVIPSVADIWPAADWHEREAYDLMGITFSGHPDFRRILLPDDWEGYPLRKDYEFPLEYHGIPATTEYDLPNPRH